MAYRGNGMIVTKSLGKIVGLFLAMYVFEQILDTILPTFYTCQNATMTINLSSLGGTINCINTTDIEVGNVTQSSYFATVVIFLYNLLPVITIIGAFEIIYRGLKQSGIM